MREEKDPTEGLAKYQPNRAPPVPRPLHQNSPAQTINRETGRRVWAVNRLTPGSQQTYRLGSQPTYPRQSTDLPREPENTVSTDYAWSKPFCSGQVSTDFLSHCSAGAIHDQTLNPRCQRTIRGPRYPAGARCQQTTLAPPPLVIAIQAPRFPKT